MKGRTWRHFVNAQTYQVNYHPQNLGNGYTGPPNRCAGDQIEAESVDQLVNELGMTLVEWDGWYVCLSTTCYHL